MDMPLKGHCWMWMEIDISPLCPMDVRKCTGAKILISGDYILGEDPASILGHPKSIYNEYGGKTPFEETTGKLSLVAYALQKGFSYFKAFIQDTIQFCKVEDDVACDTMIEYGVRDIHALRSIDSNCFLQYLKTTYQNMYPKMI
jgi:hypothetical protein